MDLKQSFLFTSFLFVFLLSFSYFYHPLEENLDKIEIQRGTSGFISFVFADSKDGYGTNLKPSEVSTQEGSLVEEINKIKNKISYPPQALEDGLESECEWSVLINSEKKATQIKTIRPCRYKIFEEEFFRVIQDWNFSLPENTILHIPVDFKIQVTTK